MELTEDDVLQILNLIEKSNFDFLQLDLGDLKLIVSKSGYGNFSASTPPAPAAGEAIIDQKETQILMEQHDAEAKASVVQEGITPIKAPMVGTFYTTPEPGAAPFVKVGDDVDEETTVGLIEIMKVFNAVTSGVRGAVVQVCVQNGQFVEYGQTLLLVRPDQ
jgi:acetyl-CoA carboxylase biotin carboxyl carrier protein